MCGARMLRSFTCPLQAQLSFNEGWRQVQCGRHAEAVACFTSAHSKGYSLAAAHLSWLLLFGFPGVPQDHSRAFGLLASVNHAQCCHCQGCLACCYAEGWGAPKTPALALALAEQSASAGSCFGLYMMGWFLENGGGVAEVNKSLALELYKRAASMGLAAAQYNAGFMYAVACSSSERVHLPPIPDF
jgi:TPR repeat protein